MKKTIISLLIFYIILFLGPFSCYSNAISIDGMIKQGDGFVKTGEDSKTDTIDGDNFTKTVKQVYRVLLGIGIGVSVIIIGIMGVKIMIGSVEEKAEIKEKMIPYIIGCGVMFGAFAIWRIAMVIAGSIS